MEIRALVDSWFQKWESGDFQNLPIAEDFQHTSPYGIISGKGPYLELVAANLDKFLGHKFIIHDQIYEGNRGCIRYTALKDDFRLEVSEWHYERNGLIQEIVAHYNIEGEISEARKLNMD